MRKYTRLFQSSFLTHVDFARDNRGGDVREWFVACVCENCNNGWMSRLEKRAGPIMVPLITGQQTRLTPSQQRIVATWAALKAMVAEYGDTEWVTTHHAQRKYLMRHLLPPPKGWAIWIAHYERKIWGPFWLSRPFLITSDKKIARYPNRIAPHFNSHATTQVLGQLFIHVIRSPHQNFVNRWRFALPPGKAIFRIWPPSDFSVPWPTGTLDDVTAQYVGDAVSAFVMRVAAAEATEPLG